MRFEINKNQILEKIRKYRFDIIKLIMIIPLIFQGIYIILRVLKMWWLPYGMSTRDGITHLLFALMIKDKHNPWVPYSQFPQLYMNYMSEYVNYIFPNAYPSMYHTFLSLFIYLGVDPILAQKILVSNIFIIGLFLYFLVFKYIIKDNILAVGGVFFLVISSARELQTFKDGSYGELLAMMVFLPSSLFLLLNSRWGEASIFISGILYSHNLTTIHSFFPIMTMYLQSFVLRKNERKKIILSTIYIVSLSLPIIILSYFPSVFHYFHNIAGVSRIGGWQEFPANDPNFSLIVLGGLSSLVLLASYKLDILWIVLWYGGMLLLSMSDLFPGRFVRALSFPSAIILYLSLAFLIKFLFEKFNSYKYLVLIVNKKQIRIKFNLILFFLSYILAIGICLLPIFLKLFELSLAVTEPTILDYWDDEKIAIYKLLRNSLSSNEAVIIVTDFWAKFFLYPSPVLQIATISFSNSLNYYDRIVNEQILLILNNSINCENYYVDDNKIIIKYVILSSIMPERWYTIDEIMLVNEIEQMMNKNPLFEKILDTTTAYGWIKVYKSTKHCIIKIAPLSLDVQHLLAIRVLLVASAMALLVISWRSIKLEIKKFSFKKILYLLILLIIIWFWIGIVFM